MMLLFTKGDSDKSPFIEWDFTTTVLGPLGSLDSGFQDIALERAFPGIFLVNDNS